MRELVRYRRGYFYIRGVIIASGLFHQRKKDPFRPSKSRCFQRQPQAPRQNNSLESITMPGLPDESRRLFIRPRRNLPPRLTNRRRGVSSSRAYSNRNDASKPTLDDTSASSKPTLDDTSSSSSSFLPEGGRIPENTSVDVAIAMHEVPFSADFLSAMSLRDVVDPTIQEKPGAEARLNSFSCTPCVQ